jgi:hypothetical protein
MRRTIAVLAFVAASALGSSPAAADPLPPPLATALANLSSAKTFHVVVEAHGHTVAVDSVKPGRFHVTGVGGHLDAIEIGGTSYVKLGSTWHKFPVPGLSDTLDPIEKLNDLATAHANELTIKDLGTSTIDGAPMHGYSIARTSSAKALKSPSSFFIGGDGMVHQITQHTRMGMVTLTFSNYNAPVTIVAPQ